LSEIDETVHEIAELRKLTVGGLKAKYLAVFGEETKSNNKPYLFKRIAYRIQEKKHGGLSARAQKQAAALAEDAPIRRRPRLGTGKAKEGPAPKVDARLPAVGTVLVREFDGRKHSATVTADGFEYKGKAYRSLSAIARKITGTSWNGFGFFGLLVKEEKT
jgi:hypothetical protein